MEYLAGEDCGRLLWREGPLQPERAANIVLQACRGLAVAHRVGIVHRDLKPANLLLTDPGDGSDLVKVLDFGIAKLRLPEATVATGTGETFGTAHYMSPEQARAAADVDARTDVWALGVVLYEFLTGRRPFEDGAFLNVIYQILSTPPPALGALRPGLAPGLVAIVERAMAKDLDRRYQSVTALGEALGAFVDQVRSVASAKRSGGIAAMSLSGATLLTPATAIDARGGDGADAAPGRAPAGRVSCRRRALPSSHARRGDGWGSDSRWYRWLRWPAGRLSSSRPGGARRARSPLGRRTALSRRPV